MTETRKSATGLYLKVEDKAAVQAAIDAVEGRATARTVSAAYVQVLAERAQRKINFLPKRLQVGATVTYDEGGPSAKAYKHAAEATRVELVLSPSGWRLTAVERITVWPLQKGADAVVVPHMPSAEFLERLAAHVGIGCRAESQPEAIAS